MFLFRPKTIFRFNILVIFGFTVFAVVIVANAAAIMFQQRDTWNKIKERYIQDSIPLIPERGRILDEDGNLIISSLPSYRLRIDFVYINEDNQRDAEKVRNKREELWKKHIDEVCEGLNKIYPDVSAKTFKKRIQEALKKKNRNFRLYNGRTSYTQYNKLLKLPIFCLGKKYSGLFFEKVELQSPDGKSTIERKNIFGDIGRSTFGLVKESYKDGKQIVVKNGLEKKYDSALGGKPGIGRKETNRKGDVITKILAPPEPGMDVQTTINTEMLDICEDALKTMLTRHRLPAGWAVLMETKTGDIKAIVNLVRNNKSNGEIEYFETSASHPNNPTPNHALCRLMEPGSIFKTVVITAMLHDKRATVNDSVIAYKSKRVIYDGRPVTDLVYRDNGTGKYSMGEVLKYSSNIGMVQYIKKAYGKDPRNFIKTLDHFGLRQCHKIIDEEEKPKITTPDDVKIWSRSSLNSLSRGYATEMTALSILNFYNTIANGGKQMQPRLVKAILNKGEVVEEFPTKVINEQMISKEVVDDVTELLVNVVHGKDGTGASAKSSLMKVAGKTGTANLVNPKTKSYEDYGKMMSFCGFFPADDPQYTLIVQTIYENHQDDRSADNKAKLGGGSVSGKVFKEIAERIMARRLTKPIEDAKDSKKAHAPIVKNGNINEAEYVLSEMGMNGASGDRSTDWGEIETGKESKYSYTPQKTDINTVPDLTGMGAKDALYLLQRRKLKVIINGYGTVRQQSMPPGSRYTPGETITLTLEN